MFSKFTTFFHHAVEALSSSESSVYDFQNNWSQITQFFVNCKDYKMSIYQTNLPELIDKLLEQIIDEEANNESGVAGPCLEYVLQNRILETLYTMARTDCPPGMKQVVLQTFANLLSKIKHPILPHVNVHRPIQKLVRICGEVRAGPTEIEEVQFLLVLCAKIKSDSHLVNFFIENVKAFHLNMNELKNENKRFLLVDSLLLLANSEDARVAVKACEGLLLLASLPDDNSAQTIIDSTKFIDHLSNKLVHLHSRLPKLMPSDEVMYIDVKWGLDRTNYMEDGVQSFEGRRVLIALLSWLDFCDQLITSAHPIISYPLCTAIEVMFLKGAFLPYLLQTSEGIVITATACLTSCLKVVSSKHLHDSFVHFIIANEENVLRNRLFNRCMHVSEELCVTTWRLFEMLTARPHKYVLQYLVLTNYQNFETCINPDSEKLLCCSQNDILEVIDRFLAILPEFLLNYNGENEKNGDELDEEISNNEYDSYLREASQKFLPFRERLTELMNVKKLDFEIMNETFLDILFSRLSSMLNQSYELNLRVTSVISQLCLIPHPAICHLLFHNSPSILSILQQLGSSLENQAKSMINFTKLFCEYKKKLLSPTLSVSRECIDDFLSGVIILAEFRKELAAIAFVKHC